MGGKGLGEGDKEGMEGGPKSAWSILQQLTSLCMLIKQLYSWQIESMTLVSFLIVHYRAPTHRQGHIDLFLSSSTSFQDRQSTWLRQP